MLDAIVILVAFVVSLAVGHVFVRWGLHISHRGYKESSPHPLAGAVGVIERVIYTSVIIAGLPIEVIGGWVALKGLAQFAIRQQTSATKQVPVPVAVDKHAAAGGDDKSAAAPEDEAAHNLDTYYSYLIGTGLSLIVGVGSGFACRVFLSPSAKNFLSTVTE